MNNNINRYRCNQENLPQLRPAISFKVKAETEIDLPIGAVLNATGCSSTGDYIMKTEIEGKKYTNIRIPRWYIGDGSVTVEGEPPLQELEGGKRRKTRHQKRKTHRRHRKTSRKH